MEKATEIWRRLVCEPGNPYGWHQLALIARQNGDFSLALMLIDKAIECDPGLARYHAERGGVLARLGRPGEALAACDEALRLSPDLAEAHLCRGAVLLNMGRPGEALVACDEALRHSPDLAGAHLNRGVILKGMGRPGEALAAYDEVLRLRPDLAQAHLDRGNALMGMGRLGEALAAYDEALRLRPDYAEAHSNYLACLNYDPTQDDDALFEAHRRWGERFGRSPHALTVHRNAPDPDKTLRVGLVSPDLGQHPIGYFTESTLAALDRARVQVLCYSGRLKEDEVTARIKAYASVWRSTIGVSDRELAEAVIADGVDILIDLAGHMAGSRLTAFALKPAPVQATWIGYPFTTGLAAVDYVFLDETSVTPGAERWFVERIVTLGPCRFCYTPPEYAPEVADPPALRRGRVTFGSFNNLAKVTPGVVQLWGRLLRAVPEAHLILKWPTLTDPGVRARYIGLFAEQGIDPARLELRGRSPHAAMLSEYADVDIALDPFPFAGGLTSAEALWQGVPVVTLPGTRPASRQSQGFLSALGRTEWIARDADDFVRIAADLAADPDRLALLRRGQRARMAASPAVTRPALPATSRPCCAPYGATGAGPSHATGSPLAEANKHALRRCPCQINDARRRARPGVAPPARS